MSTVVEFIDEEWRPVPGYERNYEVSSHGRGAVAELRAAAEQNLYHCTDEFELAADHLVSVAAQTPGETPAKIVEA